MCRSFGVGPEGTETQRRTASTRERVWRNGRKLEPLWLNAAIPCNGVNSIRTSVRKVTGATDNSGRVAAALNGHTYPVLILLPPSEKKSTVEGPAITVYTGVLYQGLDWSTLPKAAQNRGAKAITIISAKYGAISPTTVIKAYKEKIDNNAMRPLVGAVLDKNKSDLIIDCRSSTYQNVWRSPVEKTIEIKVFTKVGGVKKTITHMSKKTRGEVVRAILISKTAPKEPAQLAQILKQSFACTLLKGDEANPWVLEVYV
ncbi:MAG: hypothetical protein RL147_750 [Actinomycetota bacterium]